MLDCQVLSEPVQGAVQGNVMWLPIMGDSKSTIKFLSLRRIGDCRIQC